MILGIFFLKETHPVLATRADITLDLLRRLRRLISGKFGSQGKQTYTRVPEDESLTQTEPGYHRVETEVEELEMQSSRNSSESSTLRANSPVQEEGEATPKTAFTAQVLLQILSVSFLAFHKVSSDAIMPTFLALPQSKETEQGTETGFLRFSGGFGLTTQHIGYILLAQACVAIVAQLAIIPKVVDKFGALRTYRYVLCVFPFMYLFTPFLVKLSPPLSTIALVLDLCVKVVLSSTGYVCSAILYALPNTSTHLSISHN